MYRALLLHRADDGISPEITSLDEDQFPKGEVVVDVAYSSLNYKDGLAITGRGKVIRGAFPFVPGIDLAGTVVDDSTGTFAPGARIVLTGWGTGEERWGGFAEMARASASHLIALPDHLSLEQSMVVGTAGFTAMLAVMTLEDHDVTPEKGEVVVTGASGGAGSVAVAILSQLGYQVVASTGKKEAHGFLTDLGAHRIIHRDELGGGPNRALESARWAGAVDGVGGATLASLIAQTQTHGSIASYGNAQSPTLETTVFPFILRGVNLLGIDSNTCPMPRREVAWQRLADLLTEDVLGRLHTETIAMEALPEFADRITRGKVLGRVVVDPSGG